MILISGRANLLIMILISGRVSLLKSIHKIMNIFLRAYGAKQTLF